MGRPAILVGLCGSAMLALACEAILGVDFASQRLATCTLALPPAPFDGGDTGNSASFVAVVYSVDWGEGDEADGGAPRASSIGYDVDGRCTSVLDRPACEPAPWTGATVVDGPNGIDNAIGRMLHDQASAFGQRVFTSAFLTRSIQSGSQAPSAIFRVSDFSGFAEDSQVTVEWFVPAAPKAPPKWDGTDVWAIAPGTADATDAGGVMSQYIDRGAYVTGYRLVAHFPQGTPVVISSAPVATVSAVFSANLGQSVAGRWEMHDGIIAGRARTTEVFRDVPQLSASFAGTTTAICKDTPTVYANTKKWICAHADLLLGSGPSCDGLSYGVQFDTRSGQIGALSAPTAPVAFCKPGQDPADDSCEAPR